MNKTVMRVETSFHEVKSKDGKKSTLYVRVPKPFADEVKNKRPVFVFDEETKRYMIVFE